MPGVDASAHMDPGVPEEAEDNRRSHTGSQTSQPEAHRTPRPSELPAHMGRPQSHVRTKPGQPQL